MFGAYEQHIDLCNQPWSSVRLAVPSSVIQAKQSVLDMYKMFKQILPYLPSLQALLTHKILYPMQVIDLR